jgi:nicotinamidase-related amidase
MLTRGIIASNVSIFIIAALITMVILFYCSPVTASDEKTVIEVWDIIKAPGPVEIKIVKLNPKNSAFLVLDIEERTCNSKRRPRCVASTPKIKKFLKKVRNNGITVIYSLTRKGTPETILPDAAPLGNEPIVKSSVDKFYKTDLEKILQNKGIQTVIIVGTTAEGAVLHTATGAAMRGFQVVVPIDGMSAGTLYAEQYTAWHLVNAPGSRRRTTLTRFDLIQF